jgi:hypothetical protein
VSALRQGPSRCASWCAPIVVVGAANQATFFKLAIEERSNRRSEWQ